MSRDHGNFHKQCSANTAYCPFGTTRGATCLETLPIPSVQKLNWQHNSTPLNTNCTHAPSTNSTKHVTGCAGSGMRAFERLARQRHHPHTCRCCGCSTLPYTQLPHCVRYGAGIKSSARNALAAAPFAASAAAAARLRAMPAAALCRKTVAGACSRRLAGCALCCSCCRCCACFC